MGVQRKGGKKNRKHGRKKRRPGFARHPARQRERKIKHMMRCNAMTRGAATVVWDAGEPTPRIDVGHRQRATARHWRPEGSVDG